jgi:hypothetical protein
MGRERSDSRRSPRLLHHLAVLLSLAGQRGVGRKAHAAEATEGRPSAAWRRRRQHLAMAQRLLDPLPASLRPPDQQAEGFWRALRWGGAGFLLAWWLAR